jgi:DHA3 family tetracycline resistance protein-like MFS transporter
MEGLPPPERLDPAPPPAGLRILQPLRIRDFALLFAGTGTSLLGDGVYTVTIAWQVYELSNAPTALSVVGLAWTLPMVLFLLVGGVLGDRIDRRRLLIVSDLIRATAVGTMATLALTGAIELWHLIALVVLYGTGQALFAPSFQAILPEVVPPGSLVQANSLQQLSDPLAYRLAGPALGGVVIGALGTGEAFLIDTLTYSVSIACVSMMRPLPRGTPSEQPSIGSELREGMNFVHSQTWLWATLSAAAVTLLLWIGPLEVLLPFVVKNEYGGGAEGLGLIFAAIGAGAIGSAAVIGQRGLGRKHVLWMYLGWGASTLALAGYGIVHEVWAAMMIAFVAGIGEGIGNITWVTLMHRHVPDRLLGRVSSLDWMVSIGLVPVSFVLAGPVAEWVGVEATMIGASVLATVAFLTFLAIPGVRAPERWAPDYEAEPEPQPAPI